MNHPQLPVLLRLLEEVRRLREAERGRQGEGYDGLREGHRSHPPLRRPLDTLLGEDAFQNSKSSVSFHTGHVSYFDNFY